MRGILGILTLAFTGVIVADLITHPQALSTGGAALGNLLAINYAAMLGSNPLANMPRQPTG